MRLLLLGLTLPFLIIAGLAYFYLEDTNTKAIIIGLSFLPLTIMYIFRPQLEWWWYTRNPQRVAKPMRSVLLKFFPYYNNLSEENKILFEQRMFMFMLSKSYQKKVIETIPEDLKGLIAANAIMLTFGLEKYLSPKFENIIFYPNKFPSPAIKEFHACESFEDGDFGGMIFAIDHIMLAMRSEGQYNVVLHELANVLWKEEGWSEKDFLEIATPQNLQKLANIRGFKLAQVRTLLGKPSINFYAVLIEHFFAEPQNFQAIFPNLYKNIANRLNQNPLKKSNPVLINQFITGK
ncbi:MAG: zinc-dependent peptidase [Saprospiraceae bacterium]